MADTATGRSDAPEVSIGWTLVLCDFHHAVARLNLGQGASPLAAASAGGQQSSSAAPAKDRLPLQWQCACRCAAALGLRGLAHLEEGVVRYAAKGARQTYLLDRPTRDPWFE